MIPPSLRDPYAFTMARQRSGVPWLQRVLLAIGMLGGGLLLPQILEAQCTATELPGSCTVDRGPYRATVRGTVRLSVTPSDLDLGSPDFNDYNQGYSEMNGHSVEIRSNIPWELSIRASQTTWNGTGGGRANKPRADLEWSLNSAGPFTGLTGNNASANVLVTTGTATASHEVNLYYRVVWSWALDIPGTYTLPIVFTLSAP